MGRGLFSFPIRDKKIDDANCIADLDALISKPIAIRWEGHAHYIKPIDLQTWLQASNSLNKAIIAFNKKQITEDELLDLYGEIFSSVCDTIGAKEVRRMTQAQCGAMLQLVVDTVAGRAHTLPSTEDSQKKNLTG